ncbi:MAG: topoisomerase DNA-binding C4 zinc finger domain-containing protein [Campylobacterales bacterium]|nr:topoisomerase DNA-binding C4 zinc finger domain-containing protein [Campylobacterales bacterium]
MHVENLKQRKEAGVYKRTLACSKCGSTMVLRKNRQDGQEFYGCSSYPSARIL